MTEILLAVAITLLLVLIFLYLRNRPSEDAGAEIQAVSERMERTVREENKQSRAEAGENFSRFQRELKDDMARQEIRSREDSKSLRESFEQFSAHLDAGLEKNFKTFDETIRERFNQMSKYSAEQNERITAVLKDTTEILDKKLQNIREDNEKQLERMRVTVDEKLQTTLEKRLTESFNRVTDLLGTVHKGLGEMHSLAVNVGDLKNVLTNVKIRGTWGEYQLGNILEQMLSPEQYEYNAHPNPSKPAGVVEYAVKMPGRDDSDAPVYLPIDSKFPKEDYEMLVNASEAGDPDGVAAARKNLLARVKSFAREIREKYIEPPYTTNFAIMFMPVEAIYAEILREPGFFEDLQRTYKVTITGPTTLAAYLNSLQMGFRTLAITKRSDEIWKTLSAVKTEFGTFSAALDKVYTQVTTAQTTLGKLRTTRVNKMNTRLKGLETIDGNEAQSLLGLDDTRDIEYEQDEQDNNN